MRMPDDAEVRSGLVLTPVRDDLSDAMLTEVATECRDMAVAVAVCRSMKREESRVGVEWVKAELDESVEAAFRKHFVPATGEDATT